MSFLINGVEWTPETATQHAQQMLAVINADRSSRGESPLIASPGNAVWLILLAAGSRNQAIDEEMNIGLNSLNPALCDDDQILNILPMVGTQRIPATRSTTVVTVTVNDTGAPITIPAGSTLPFGNINFLTDDEYTNATPPATIDIPVTCDTPGAIVCPANSLTSFGAPITNVASVNNDDPASVGVAEETIAQVRQRVILGDTIPYGINAAIRAIRSLTGITAANVFFNFSNSDDLTLPGDIDVPPRTAYIVITGFSDGLAVAYYEAMVANTVGDESQNYITLAGQEIPVFYNIAVAQDIWVKVYYDDTKPFLAGFDTVVKQNIVQSQSSFLPGQEVTSQFLSENPLRDFQLATLTGVEVSIDGMSYDRVAIVDANKFAAFDNARIDVIAE
jgi:hypothetical protein